MIPQEVGRPPSRLTLHVQRRLADHRITVFVDQLLGLGGYVLVQVPLLWVGGCDGVCVRLCAGICRYAYMLICGNVDIEICVILVIRT